jgi:hypothetical protein
MLSRVCFKNFFFDTLVTTLKINNPIELKKFLGHARLGTKIMNNVG